MRILFNACLEQIFIITTNLQGKFFPNYDFFFFSFAQNPSLLQKSLEKCHTHRPEKLSSLRGTESSFAFALGEIYADFFFLTLRFGRRNKCKTQIHNNHCLLPSFRYDERSLVVIDVEYDELVSRRISGRNRLH